MACLIDRYDGLLLDLDGVLYRGESAIPGAIDTMREVRRRGLPIAFLTNNATRTPAEVAAKLTGLGFEAAVEEVETSATAAVRELVRLGIQRAVVVGQAGLLEVLEQAGIRRVGPDDSPEAVVVGGDFAVTYDRIRDAAIAARTGIPFYATNADPTFPVADGRLWPGAGAILAAVEVASDARAIVVGKPGPSMYEAARERMRASAPLAVGDRIDTDILGASRLGLQSLLVLSGVTQAEDLDTSEATPTFVGPDITTLLDERDVRPWVGASDR